MKRLFTILLCINFVNIALGEEIKKDSIYKHVNLKEFKVNATRANLKLKDIPSKVEIISERMIQNSSASNLCDLLKSSTGIDIIQYPGVSAFVGIRGFAPKSTSSRYSLILIDGIPSGTQNLASISLNNIKTVEILKGPFSSLYGSGAMGGIINIVTKKNTNKINTNIDLGVGSYGKIYTNILTAGKITNKLSFSLTYEKEEQNNNYKTGGNNLISPNKKENIILGKEDSKNTRIENSTYDKNNLNTNLAYNFNDKLSVTLNYSYFFTNEINNPGSYFGIGEEKRKKKDIKRHNAGLGITYKNNNHKLNLNSFFSTEDNVFYSGIKTTDFNNTNTTLKTKGVQLQDIINYKQHSFSLGVDYKDEANNIQQFSAKDIEKTSYKPNYSNSSISTYLQANFKFINDKLIVSTGGRMDFVKLSIDENKELKSEEVNEKYNSINGNIGTKYHLTKNLSIYSSWGTAFLSPSALEKAGLYVSSYGTYKGNPDLKPEKSNTLDLGINYNNNNLHTNISWFSTQLTDKITSAQNENIKSYANADKAHMRGLEFDLRYDLKELFNNKISISPFVNWTWIYEAKETSKNTESDSKYIREHNGNFGIRVSDFNKFDSSFKIRYAGKRTEDNFNNWNSSREKLDKIIEMPSFYVFDLSGSYQINNMFKISLYLNNMLNERYSEKDGYFMAGRNFMAKLHINF